MRNAPNCLNLSMAKISNDNETKTDNTSSSSQFIPPIFRWAQSLSDNLEKLEKDLEFDQKAIADAKAKHNIQTASYDRENSATPDKKSARSRSAKSTHRSSTTKLQTDNPTTTQGNNSSRAQTPTNTNGMSTNKSEKNINNNLGKKFWNENDSALHTGYQSQESIISFQPMSFNMEQYARDASQSPSKNQTQFRLLTVQKQSTKNTNTRSRSSLADEPMNKSDRKLARMSSHLRSSVAHATHTGNAVVAEVARRIWGKNIPQTFITALDLTVDATDENDSTKQKNMSKQQSESRKSMQDGDGSSVKHRKSVKSIYLPVLKATKEEIPPEIVEKNLGFPSKLSGKDGKVLKEMEKIVETTEFDTEKQQRTYQTAFVSEKSQELISDAFWWFLINNFKISNPKMLTQSALFDDSSDDEDDQTHQHSENLEQQQNENENENENDDQSINQNKEKEKENRIVKQKRFENQKLQIFSRMCHSYVDLFFQVSNESKDLIFDNYYDSMSQMIFRCFYIQYPKSRKYFNDDFKYNILQMTAKWTIGCIPSSMAIDHWELQPIPISNNINNTTINFHKSNNNNNNNNNKNTPATNSHSHNSNHRMENSYISSCETNEMNNARMRQLRNEQIIPTDVSKKKIEFGHSVFVEYYLKENETQPNQEIGGGGGGNKDDNNDNNSDTNTGTIATGDDVPVIFDDKTICSLNMTFAREKSLSTTHAQMYQMYTRECSAKSEKADIVRSKLRGLEKELSKMIKSDKEVIVEFEKELKEQLFLASKNKKQFVKQILRDLIPNDVVTLDDQPEYF